MELVGEGRNAERPHKENQMTTKATRAKATKIVTREAVGGKVATKVAKVTEEVKATKEVKADLRLTRRQEVRVATGGYCLCGCGAAANRGRLFVQGHDARLKGQLLRLGRGEVKLDSLPKSVQQLLPTLKTCGLTSRLVKRIASRQGGNPPSAQGDPLFGVSLISMRKVNSASAGMALVKIAPSVRSTDVS